MSLFSYSVILSDGKERSSTITAKTEEAARAKLEEELKIAEWRELKVAKPPHASTVANPAAPVAARKAKPAGKLDRLLYLQSDKCFFCGKVLKRGEASVEHLMPQSSNGTNDDGNVVACCVALNRTFGNISLKEKVRIILDKAGGFTCPKP